MLFPENKYVENSITEEQEEKLIKYSEYYVDYLIARVDASKHAGKKHAGDRVLEAKQKMMEYMPYVKDIKITEQESNIYSLVAAAKKKRVDIFYEFLGDLSEIDKSYRVWYEIFKMNVNHAFSSPNAKAAPVNSKKLEEAKWIFNRSIQSLKSKFIMQNKGIILKNIKVGYTWVYETAFITAHINYCHMHLADNNIEKKDHIPFSVLYVKALLEKIAATYINLKAEITVLKQTENKIVGDVNGTVCSLELLENDVIAFECPEIPKKKKELKGTAQMLSKMRLGLCYSLFVNTIYAEDIKAQYAYAPINKKKILEKTDVLVKSTIQYCSNKNHYVEDVIAKVLVMTSEKVKWNYFHAAYCHDCKQYFILNEDYKKLEGTPLCQVIEIKNGKERIIRNTSGPSEGSGETMIHSYGYNVNMNENLSEEYRRKILVDLIENKIVSQEVVLSYLDSLVLRGLGSSKYKNAVEKWKSDRKYIEEQWYSQKEFEVKYITREIKQNSLEEK